MTTDDNSEIAIDSPNDEARYRKMRERHPSRVGVGRAGSRPRTSTLLQFRLDHGEARDAVSTHVPDQLAEQLGLVSIQSKASSKTEFLANPNLGRDITDETAATLRDQCVEGPDVQIVVSDGLSSTAVESNLPDLLPSLFDGLDARDLNVGTPVFVEYGRVNVMDAIGEELDADCCVNLIGERPGLATNESLSAYFIYGPLRGSSTSKKSVISNIHRNGIPPVEAGAEIATVLAEIYENKQSGIDLGDR
ncbi:ethanolamine ammonia-lyase subunit EutC [Halobellus sp. Atlit-31R]|nr:ethanolamine ammonia-lyase subunit EutC [Halobellus sp. Atlit-31R]